MPEVHLSGTATIHLRTFRGAGGEALARALGDGAEVGLLGPGDPLPPAPEGTRRVIELRRDGRALLAELAAAAPERTSLEILCEDVYPQLVEFGRDPGCAIVGPLRLEALAAADAVGGLSPAELGRLRAAAASLGRTAHALGPGERFAFDAVCGDCNASLGYPRDAFTLEEHAALGEALREAIEVLPCLAAHADRLRAVLGAEALPEAERAGGPRAFGVRVAAALDRRGLLPPFLRGRGSPAAPGGY